MDKRGKNVGAYKAYKVKKVVSLTGEKTKEVEPQKIDMT